MISFSFFERRVDFLEARTQKVNRAAEEIPTGCESVYDDEFGQNCDSQSSQFVASPNRVQRQVHDGSIALPGAVLAGTQKMMSTVLPTASEPVTICKQLSDRLMWHVPELHASVIVVAVKLVTVPLLSVLLPEGVGRGLGAGLGRGVGLGRIGVVGVFAQLRRSAAPARMQISFFVFIG